MIAMRPEQYLDKLRAAGASRRRIAAFRVRRSVHRIWMESSGACPLEPGEPVEPVEPVELDLGESKFDLTLFVTAGDDSLECGVEYRTDRFDAVSRQDIPEVEIRVENSDPEWFVRGDPSPASIQLGITGPARDLFRVAVDDQHFFSIGKVNDAPTAVVNL